MIKMSRNEPYLRLDGNDTSAKEMDKNRWTALIIFVGAVKTLMGSYRNKYPKTLKASHYISTESIHDRVAL